MYNDTLDGFQRNMDMAKKSRVEKEHDELQKLRLLISKLEETLTREVKRRTETNKAMQAMFEAHLVTVQDKLECGLLERLDNLMATVDALNERVGVVEVDFRTERARYVRDMEDKSAMVARDIAALRSAFSQEWSERKGRETLIIAKLRDLDERSAERLVQEQQICDEQVEELRQDVVVVAQQEDRRFHDHVFQELAALKNGLVLESQTREQSDDDITAALRHYTESIQEAMRVVNQAT